MVIAFNEELRIAGCLESVLDEVRGMHADVTVVDAASTDRTVRIAIRYPVRVVRLEPAARRPAIGRHVGTLLTSGRFVLFVDGDMVLEPGSVSAALDALDADPALAGIAGACSGILVRPDGSVEVSDQYPGVAYDDPPHLSGSAIYRRGALLRAGGFSPYMRGHEEPDLGFRLRRAGFTLRRLRVTMSRHFPHGSRETLRELIRRVRRGYVIGMGQFARRGLAAGVPAREAIAPIRRILEFGMLLLAGVALAGVAAVTGAKWPIVLWRGLMSAVFLTFAVRARSLRKPTYYFAEWTLMLGPVLYGLLLPAQPPERFGAFPVRFDVVAEPRQPEDRRRSAC